MAQSERPLDFTEDEIFSLPTGDEAPEDAGLDWDDICVDSDGSPFQTSLVDPNKHVEDEVLPAVRKKGSDGRECSNSRVTPAKKKKLRGSSSASGQRRKRPMSWREFEMERARMGMVFAEGERTLIGAIFRARYLQSLFPDSWLKHPFGHNYLQPPQPVDHCMFGRQAPSLVGEHVHDVLATNMIAPTVLPKADGFAPTTAIDVSEVFPVGEPHEPDSVFSSLIIPKDTPKLIFLKLDVREVEAILAAGSCNVYIH